MLFGGFLEIYYLFEVQFRSPGRNKFLQTDYSFFNQKCLVEAKKSFDKDKTYIKIT